MNSFYITLHYKYIHFTDPMFVPRQLNMKQVTNIHKMTHKNLKKETLICVRTTRTTKTTNIIELEYKI